MSVRKTYDLEDKVTAGHSQVQRRVVDGKVVNWHSMLLGWLRQVFYYIIILLHSKQATRRT